MPRKNHPKRAFLFLAAVLLPSAVLVGTTVRLIRQERELAVRRAEEDRNRLALQVGQDLVEDLRQIWFRVEGVSLSPEDIRWVAGPDSALLTVAALRGGSLVFPWEMGPDPSGLLDPAALSRHASLRQRGSEAEHRARDFAGAADLYGQASEVPGIGPYLVAEARVDQARVLHLAGKMDEAREAFFLLAHNPAFLTDLDQMPFFIYGLEGLHLTGADQGELRNLLEGSLDGVHHFSLTALLAWRTLADEILASEPNMGGPAGREGRENADLLRRVKEVVEERAAVLEALESLRTDFDGLRARALGERRTGEDPVGPIWMPHGEEPWLAGFVPGETDTANRVAVVRPALLLDSAGEPGPDKTRLSSAEVEGDPVPPARSAITLLPAGGTEGESLGPDLNGLRGVFPPRYPSHETAGGVEGWFFRLLLPIILILTGFTAYLAWRDVRRETEAVRLRSQFVSSVTHELKTPLTSIRMFAETLRLGRHSGAKTQQEYLDTVVHETERLSRLINNVLDFARIERGDKTYQMAPTDVGAVVQEAARAVAYPLSQGGYKLNTTIAEGLPWIDADSDALTQAVLNLLSNAIKFSEEDSEIDLRVFVEVEELCLQVEDRGRGIDPIDQEAVFTDFYRTSDVEEDGIPGTGLGLSLVAHVVEAHGGHVDVESEVGRGSVFTIRIPIEGRSSDEEGAS